MASDRWRIVEMLLTHQYLQGVQIAADTFTKTSIPSLIFVISEMHCLSSLCYAGGCTDCPSVTSLAQAPACCSSGDTPAGVSEFRSSAEPISGMFVSMDTLQLVHCRFLWHRNSTSTRCGVTLDDFVPRSRVTNQRNAIFKKQSEFGWPKSFANAPGLVKD